MDILENILNLAINENLLKDNIINNDLKGFYFNKLYDPQKDKEKNYKNNILLLHFDFINNYNVNYDLSKIYQIIDNYINPQIINKIIIENQNKNFLELYFYYKLL